MDLGMVMLLALEKKIEYSMCDFDFQLVCREVAKWIKRFVFKC